MRKVELKELTTYEAPKHFNMVARRLEREKGSAHRCEGCRGDAARPTIDEGRAEALREADVRVPET